MLIRPTIDIWINKSLIPGNKYANFNIAAVIAFSILATFILSYSRTNYIKILGKKNRAPLVIIFLLFIIYSGLISFIFSINQTIAFADWMRLITVFAFYIICYRYVNTEKKARKFINALLFSSLIPVIVGFIQFLSGTGEQFLFFTRIRGTFVNPVGFGHYLTFISIISIIFWINSKRKISIYGVWACISIFCLIMTYSRGAWLGFLLAMLVMLLFTKNFSKKIGLFIILVCIIIITTFALPNIKELLILSFDIQNQEVSSVASRLFIWNNILNIFSENPIFGIGLKQTYTLLKVEPHNDYLRILLELGVLGFILYFRIIHLMYKNSIRIIKSTGISDYFNMVALVFICVYTSYLVMSISDNLFTSLVLQYPVWGLAAILHRNVPIIK